MSTPPRDSYPHASVPEYLRRTSVDTMPIQTPFYTDIEAENCYEDSVNSIIVDHQTGQLFVDGTKEIYHTDKKGSPLGRVGLMRAATIGTDHIQTALLADVRYLDTRLTPVKLDDAPSDQEEFNYWRASRENLREVVAFVASHPSTKASKQDGSIEPMFFGPADYYPQLELLANTTDALVAKALKRQAQAHKKARRAAIVAESTDFPAKKASAKDSVKEE